MFYTLCLLLHVQDIIRLISLCSVDPPATSPVMSSWLIYSRKASSFTSASVNRKQTGWPLKPAILYRPLMSSSKFVTL
jgi:hypothetical protein